MIHRRFKEVLVGIWVLLMCSCLASVIPSEAELDKERADVETLTKDDFAKLRSGQSTHVETAQALLAYAQTAETSAAHYLLVRAAFRQFLLGDDLASAVSLYDSLAEKKNRAYALEVARFSASSLNRMLEKKVDGIKVFMDRLAETDRKVKSFEGLKTQLQASPDNAELLTSIGFAAISLGQWSDSLAYFSSLTNRLGEVARYELSYPLTGLSLLTSADVAEFWWNLCNEDPRVSELEALLKAHAAPWYRQAVSNCVLRSLKKTIALKRAGEINQEVSAKLVTVSSTVSAVSIVTNLPPLRFPVIRDIEFFMVGCPPGSFIMGNPKKKIVPLTSEKLHHVTLTRPFWISRFKVTREQFKIFQKFELTDHEKTLGGMKAPMRTTYRLACEYCDYLTKKYKSKLPSGYVFRLPSEAEWEYALAFNATPDDPYAAWEEKSDEIMVGKLDWENAARAHRVDLSLFPESRRPLLPVGLKTPNARGLYDMLGNGREYTLDTVNWARTNEETALWTTRANEQKALVYEADETDPIRSFEGSFQGVVMRGVASNSEGHPFAKYVPRTLLESWGCFRIVAGPDLLAEQGIAKGNR